MYLGIGMSFVSRDILLLHLLGAFKWWGRLLSISTVILEGKHEQTNGDAGQQRSNWNTDNHRHHDNERNYLVSVCSCDWHIAVPPHICGLSKVERIARGNVVIPTPEPDPAGAEGKPGFDHPAVAA
jgi:hypothetical protein